MKRNNQNHRIIKSNKLVFKRETIKTLSSHELGGVAGGFETYSEEPTCSSSVPLCWPGG
jgi:hypothetical protein